MIGLIAISETQWIAVATIAALATGSAIRWLVLRGASPDVARLRFESLAVWWILSLLVLAAALLGPAAAAVLFAVVSALALGEFTRLAQREGGRRLLIASYALIPINYLWIWLGYREVFTAFLPLALPVLGGALLIFAGDATDYVQRAARGYWGAIVTVYFLSHTVLLFSLASPAGDGGGWFLYLILLTQTSDISQALIGRRFGRRKITPRVSPHKTAEGLAGGVVTTIVLAVALAPWLTTLDPIAAAAAGLLIAAAGFLGDLNISAVKRDAGVKDSGNLLPGQGGILDRVDSLTFAAPAFYYFVLVGRAF